MIGLIQRVSSASVSVHGELIGRIDRGLLALIAVQQGDGPSQANRLAERLLAYRVFADESGRMNLNLVEVGGGLLLVPQFTLAADTGKGSRASFAKAANPDLGQTMFDELVRCTKDRWSMVETGAFGADMDVRLVNQGPVTFWLEVPPALPAGG